MPCSDLPLDFPCGILHAVYRRCFILDILGMFYTYIWDVFFSLGDL